MIGDSLNVSPMHSVFNIIIDEHEDIEKSVLF